MVKNSKENLKRLKELYPNDKFKINEFEFKDEGKHWYYTMNSLNNCFETLNEIINAENLDVKTKTINMDKMKKIKHSIKKGGVQGPEHSEIFWPQDREFQTPELEKVENFVSQSAKEKAKKIYKKYLKTFKQRKMQTLRKLKEK